MHGHGAMEVGKTVLEVADVAWTAMECHHRSHYKHDDNNHEVTGEAKLSSVDEEFQSLRSENQRLRNVLEQNLKLLHKLSENPSLLNDCPPDFYIRLVATVNSEEYLTQLKSQQQATSDGTEIQFPFKEATGLDSHSGDMLINVDLEEPSWWVWVTNEMVPGNVEERSSIDDENYIVISEEHVMDGVANFMARCVLSNPKALNLSPEELQKTLSNALGGVSKLEKMLEIWHAGTMFYTLSTWGLALAGLYKSRTVLRLAAQGMQATSKVTLRVL
ncbi:Elongation factor 4 [Quillaja saponaria]|uniref:Elongation factor 4 n=1 Tax=Quillaja saponaria TaxID=32244 RepID=A0AAD7LLA9_QUISA|nr:Elongation factor 4 [Quillaja saponaria]